MHMWFKLIRTLIAVAALSSARAWAEDASDRQRHIQQEAVASPGDKAKVDVFIATLVEAPKGSGRYLVEGDYLLARDEIVAYLRRLKTPNSPQVLTGELIVNLTGGKFDYLAKPAQRHMNYVVEAASFPNQEDAETVRQNFRAAAREWEQKCPECGIKFTEIPLSDVTSGKVRSHFIVRYQNVEGGPIARAFFPSSAPDDRFVDVFPGYFKADMEFDKIGVFRHEIGHILGYRHEHIRNIPGCYPESGDWKPITAYTANSVMHYFCGGHGSFDLSIREADSRGHRCLYLTGKPCP